jgi:hypothetical protein
VWSTVCSYVGSLLWLSDCYELRILVIPIPHPPPSPATEQRRSYAALFNEVAVMPELH